MRAGSMSTCWRKHRAASTTTLMPCGRRRETVEHPFGMMKARMGAAHFLTKTLRRVAAEMALSVLAYNLNRVLNIIGIRPLIACDRDLRYRRVLAAEADIPMAVLTQPRPNSYIAAVAGAAVDTPSAGVHAELARSAFEVVSARNLVPIRNRADPHNPLDGSISFEWARAP